MQLFPFRRFELETPLSQEEVAQQLRDEIAAPKLLRGFGRQPVFEGHATVDTFKVWRIIPLQRWLLPVLHGKIAGTDDGCRIQVQATPSRIVLLLLLVWNAAATLLMVSPRNEQVVVSVAGALLASWLLACCGFWIDGDRGRKLLAKALGVPVGRR